MEDVCEASGQRIQIHKAAVEGGVLASVGVDIDEVDRDADRDPSANVAVAWPHEDIHGREVQVSPLLHGAPQLVRSGWDTADYEAKRESDTKVHRGRITKQGNNLVRWAAVEAVQRVHQGPLGHWRDPRRAEVLFWTTRTAIVEARIADLDGHLHAPATATCVIVHSSVTQSLT